MKDDDDLSVMRAPPTSRRDPRGEEQRILNDDPSTVQHSHVLDPRRRARDVRSPRLDHNHTPIPTHTHAPHTHSIHDTRTHVCASTHPLLLNTITPTHSHYPPSCACVPTYTLQTPFKRTRTTHTHTLQVRFFTAALRGDLLLVNAMLDAGYPVNRTDVDLYR